ncbi:hypothetical protein BDV12DRAFT_173620 [Aspergillus spectabilis]
MGLCFSLPRRRHPMMGPVMMAHPRPLHGVSYGMPMGGMGGMGCGPPRYGRSGGWGGGGYGGGRYGGGRYGGGRYRC